MKKHTVLSSTLLDLSLFTKARTALGSIDASLHPTPLVDDRERRRLQEEARRVPADFITGIAAVAASKGGSILSIPIDATETRTTLAYVSEGLSFVSALRAFATALEDDLLVKRAAVAEPASAAYNAARVSGRSVQGHALKVHLDELRALKPGRRAATKPAVAAAAPAKTSAAA